MSDYKQVKVNLAPDDYAKMAALAKKYDTTIASLFRELAGMQIDNAPVRSGGVKTKGADPELLYQLAKIGANLNQIAKRCNFYKVVDRLTYGEIINLKKKIWTLLPAALDNEEVKK